MSIFKLSAPVNRITLFIAGIVSGIFGNIAGGFQTLVGGKISIYSDLCEKTREEALFAKFSQNEDLKILLVNTRKSTLIHYIHGSPGEKDELLMKIRQKLATE